MSTNWTKIEFTNLNIVPNLDSFESNEQGLFLKCDFNGVEKTVFFENYFALRCIDEGNALKILAQHEFDGRSWMFEKSDSDLEAWFDDVSFEIHKGKYKPYIIVSLH